MKNVIGAGISFAAIIVTLFIAASATQQSLAQAQIFGFGLGGGAIAQRDAFVAAGRAQVIRFPMLPDPSGTGFDASHTTGVEDYCLSRGCTPLIRVFDRQGPDWIWPTDLTAYFEVYLHHLYGKGIRTAYFEVGNEMDSPGRWIYPSTDGTQDKVFLAYRRLYEKCSIAMNNFRVSHPDANFKLGGTAAAIGAWFSMRMLSSAQQNNLIMDFISWHHYGLHVTNEELQDQIRAVRGMTSLPIWLTEVGYDPAGKLNFSSDAVNWAKQFKWPAVDAVIWLFSSASDGAGLWLPNGAMSPIGAAVLQ
jgi:hypothetical protein